VRHDLRSVLVGRWLGIVQNGAKINRRGSMAALVWQRGCSGEHRCAVHCSSHLAASAAGTVIGRQALLISD
jgi:hypothetical protein